ncbi:hypothetical protein FQZ97_982100 [compost metagenome]
MNVGVNAACSEDFPFSRDNIGARPYNNIYARLNIRVTGFANTRDASILNANIRFDDPPIVKYDNISNDQIRSFSGWPLPLPHTVTDNLTSPKGHFLAIDTAILFNLDDKFCVRETQSVTCCGAIKLSIGLS